MKSNNFDRAEDTERKLRELIERPKDYIEDIEKKLRKLTEIVTRANAKKVKIGIGGKKIIVEQLGDLSFRVKNNVMARNDLMSMKPGDGIVLPSGEEREIRTAIPELDRIWLEPFYIYFTIKEG